MSLIFEEPPEATAARREFSAWGSTGGYGGGTKHSITVPEELRLLQDGEEAPAGHIVFRISSPEGGDERIAWNPYRIQEVAEAKRLFNELIAKGYYAYKIDPASGGRGGELVRSFNDIIPDGEVMMSEIRPALPEPLRKAAGAEQSAPEVVMHPRPVGG